MKEHALEQIAKSQHQPHLDVWAYICISHNFSEPGFVKWGNNSFFFFKDFKDFIYLFMRETHTHTHTEAETQAEGEAGSMQGA